MSAFSFKTYLVVLCLVPYYGCGGYRCGLTLKARFSSSATYCRPLEAGFGCMYEKSGRGLSSRDLENSQGMGNGRGSM